MISLEIFWGILIEKMGRNEERKEEGGVGACKRKDRIKTCELINSNNFYQFFFNKMVSFYRGVYLAGISGIYDIICAHSLRVRNSSFLEFKL